MDVQRQNLKFDSGATSYCKLCNTWGTEMPGETVCGNCMHSGHLIPNPFPDNMIPYIELNPSPVTEDKLS